MNKYQDYINFVNADNLSEVEQYIQELEKDLKYVEILEEQLADLRAELTEELYDLMIACKPLSVFNSIKVKQEKQPTLKALRAKINSMEMELLRAKEVALLASTKLEQISNALALQGDGIVEV